MQLPANFRPGAFIGTAEAYARYRPPYPRPMLDDLIARAALGSAAELRASGALLDLATGPGRVALDLAGTFARVLAVDLEPEMVAVGARRAAERGIDNITWMVGRAEDLEIVAGTFDLITIGEAFHRVEQAVVAANALRWLRPGGCFATLGADGRFSGDVPWQVKLRTVRAHWAERAFPDGYGALIPGQAADGAGREGVLLAAGFAEAESRDFAEAVEVDFESIVGILESSSVCSRNVLGSDFEPFRRDLRAALGADGSSRFPETIRWGYTLGRKPNA
jgi:SAM-dependent methyltransferase